MSNRKSQKKNRRVLGIAIVALVGCGALFAILLVLGTLTPIWVPQVFPTPKPVEYLILDSVIRVQDLPQGWRSGRVKVENSPGVEGRYFTFSGASDPALTWVNVGEKLFVFKDVEAARQGYVEQSTKYFPPEAADEWKRTPELDFAHHADEMKIACLPSVINGESFSACGAVGRYQNMVVVMMGNVSNLITRFLNIS